VREYDSHLNLGKDWCVAILLGRPAVGIEVSENNNIILT